LQATKGMHENDVDAEIKYMHNL